MFRFAWLLLRAQPLALSYLVGVKRDRVFSFASAGRTVTERQASRVLFTPPDFMQRHRWKRMHGRPRQLHASFFHPFNLVRMHVINLPAVHMTSTDQYG